MKQDSNHLLRLIFAAVLAAMVFVVTLFRFPLLGSQVHFANAVCLLSGLLLGPVWGGAAAGMGSFLYDLCLYNKGPVNLLITFVTKFLMATICALVFRAFGKKRREPAPLVICCVAGALSYVVMYMLKSGIDGVISGKAFWGVIATKFPASIINAGAAIIATPIFYSAVRPALKAGGIMKELEWVKE